MLYYGSFSTWQSLGNSSRVIHGMMYVCMAILTFEFALFLDYFKCFFYILCALTLLVLSKCITFAILNLVLNIELDETFCWLLVLSEALNLFYWIYNNKNIYWKLLPILNCNLLWNAALDIDIRIRNIENEKLMKDIDELKKTLLSTMSIG